MELADLQPLVLVFEDIHWAEEPMLDLIEHLASGVRDVPLLILCLARADLLDERPAWGGGKMRATAIELEALPREDSATLVDALADSESAELSPEQRAAVLGTTEGNPLFIEETVRMLLESVWTNISSFAREKSTNRFRDSMSTLLSFQRGSGRATGPRNGAPAPRR